jgi:hypothetical protein
MRSFSFIELDSLETIVNEHLNLVVLSPFQYGLTIDLQRQVKSMTKVDIISIISTGKINLFNKYTPRCINKIF